ncbi:hypothetical protein [Xenorhabdus sp. Sc-CR9]|uniref:hypothetical protein n=1 Tax=Xenorhabdus sp. Sc-CR9 TaxID=2584468 RepID=UPI001F1FC0BA|nr:hypothetical protein [Xenorhabdus sp. Sc-CR9]
MNNEILPQPLIGYLDDLLAVSSGAEKTHNVFVGHNLGERVFLLQVPIHEFYEMSEVANEQYRDGLNSLS